VRPAATPPPCPMPVGLFPSPLPAMLLSFWPSPRFLARACGALSVSVFFCFPRDRRQRFLRASVLEVVPRQSVILTSPRGFFAGRSATGSAGPSWDPPPFYTPVTSTLAALVPLGGIFSRPITYVHAWVSRLLRPPARFGVPLLPVASRVEPAHGHVLPHTA